jgi:hypothetical protein
LKSKSSVICLYMECYFSRELALMRFTDSAILVGCGAAVCHCGTVAYVSVHSHTGNAVFEIVDTLDAPRSSDSGGQCRWPCRLLGDPVYSVYRGWHRHGAEDGHDEVPSVGITGEASRPKGSVDSDQHHSPTRDAHSQPT